MHRVAVIFRRGSMICRPSGQRNQQVFLTEVCRGGRPSHGAHAVGAAVAGDWIPDRFLHDFAVSAWPAVALTAVAVLVERLSHPRSSIIRSVLTLSGYLLVAVVWVLHRGISA